MPADIKLMCACGSLTGSVNVTSARRVNRVVCYCDDCQAFARFLDEARPALDEHGGTDLLQTSQADVRFDDASKLCCVRLTPKGLLRWFASCCRSPIANILPLRTIPFVGLPVTALRNASGDRVSDEARDSLAGPVRARVHGRFAAGNIDAHPHIPMHYALRVGRMILAASLRGDRRRSPFFDPPTGAPVAQPLILDSETLDRLKKVQAA